MDKKKDYFSSSSEKYALFRPQYPEILYNYIYERVSDFDKALDAGTGNGQVAHVLSKKFKNVKAIDNSAPQVAHAFKEDNIQYSVGSAESTGFGSSTFDLVTAAQCFHWFDQQAFWNEMDRVAKPNAFIAIWGYGLMRINSKIDEIIDELYHQVLGEKYWDPARKLIDLQYQDLLFPIEEIPFPMIAMKVDWSVEHLLQYLETWSAVNSYVNKIGSNPIDLFRPMLKEHWGPSTLNVSFPLFGRLGTMPG